MKLYQKFLFELNESYSSTISKRNRAQKTRSSAGVIAVSLARKQNDPLYRKMKLYKKLYMTNKKALQKKYKSKSNILARQRASEFKYK
jgi:hypothetical protein